MPGHLTSSEKLVFPEDLLFILEKLSTILGKDSIRKEKFLITGGTGFFGKWLTQALLAINETWDAENHFTIVTRNAIRTLESSPWLANRNDVCILEEDVRRLTPSSRYSIIIHGAAAASKTLNENDPQEMFDTITEGTRAVLKLAESCSCRHFQFISSGGIYGPQPLTIDHVDEDYPGAPDPLHPNSAYGEAKRTAEFLCANAARRAGFHLTVARCFAFVGPYLPLDTHFAAGNFIADVLHGRPIKVGGDGSPLRSYLYAADLVVWLLTILIKGEKGRAYNVGSPKSISISDLAEAVHAAGIEVLPNRKSLHDPVQISKKRDPEVKPPRYVPSVDRAERELTLRAWTSLHESLVRTLKWHLEKT